VDLEAHAMAEPVAEVVAVPGLGDAVARDGVHRTALGARVDGGERLLLRRQHELVDLAGLVRELAGRERARAVRAVAVHDGAHVDDHERVRVDPHRPRVRVGQRAVRAAGDDRLERRVRGAALAHLALEVERDLALGSTHEPARAEVLVDVVGQVGGLADRAQLALVLHRAQLLHQPAGRHQLDAVRRQLLEALVLPHAHVLVLEAHAAGQALGGVGQ